MGRLKRLGGGAEEVIEVAEGICIGVGRGVVAFELLDDAVDAAGEQAEAASDAADEEGVEAVKSGEDFLVEFSCLIGLFTEEDGVNVWAIEKHDPVAGNGWMEDGHEVDLAGVGGRVAFGPDSDGVEVRGQSAVAFALGGKIIEVLEGGDEFAFGGIEGNVLDSVANGEHGFVVKEVSDVCRGEDDGFGEFGGAALC